MRNGFIAWIARVLVPTALAAALGTVPGCREVAFPPAGSYDEVLLVTEEGASDPWTERVRPYVEVEHDYITTRETSFRVKVVRAADLEEFPVVKTLLIVGVMRSGTAVGDRILSLIGDGARRVARGEATLLRKENLPAPGQATFILTAPTEEALAEAIRKRGPELEEQLEASCRRRLRRALLAHTNPRLTRRLQRRYGFTIEFPYLYRLFSEESHPPTPGIELMRDEPVRDIGIFWKDWEREPTLYDRDALFELRSKYVWKRYDHDRMDPNRVRFTYTRLGPYRAIRMSGYWENADYAAGGYFETYFVWDPGARLLWAVDLLVFAPARAKHPLVREMRAIAETFRYD